MSFNENKGAFILVGVLEVRKTPEANIGTIYESSNLFYEYLTPSRINSAFQRHLFPQLREEISYILLFEVVSTFNNSSNRIYDISFVTKLWEKMSLKGAINSRGGQIFMK